MSPALPALPVGDIFYYEYVACIASIAGRRHLLLRLCRLHCQHSRSATSFTTTMSPALPAQPVSDIFYYDYVACIARTAGRRHLLLRLCRLHCQHSRSATSFTTTMSPALPEQPVGDIFYYDYVACIASTDGRRHLSLRLCRLHCQNSRSATSFTTTMSPALPEQPVGDIFYYDYVACIASTAGRRHLLLRLCRLHCQNSRSATSFTTTMSPALPAQRVGDIFYYDYVACIARTAGRRHLLLRLCRLHCQHSRSATSFTTTMSPALPEQPVGDIFYYDYVACIASTAGRRHLLLRICRLHCQHSRSATYFTTTMSPALPAQPVGDIFYYDYVACIASTAGQRHILLRLCRLHCQNSRSATSFTTTMSPALPAQPVGDIFYYDYVACIASTAGQRHILLRLCRLHCQNSRSATSFTTTMSPALPAQPVGDIFYYDYVACIARTAGRRHLLLRLCRLHCQHSRSATSFTTTMSPALPTREVKQGLNGAR